MIELQNLLDEKSIMAHWSHLDKVYVSIVCLCFEHENYISQAIDSFLKQKTQYRFEIIIHDDKSNDGSIKILQAYKKRYPNLIKLKLQEKNLYSNGGNVVKEAVAQTSGVYIAFCEGDDWWFDDDKIEKQVNALLSQRYIMSYTSNYLFYQQKNKLSEDPINQQITQCTVDNLIQQKYIIRFGSVMVGSKALNEVINLVQDEFPSKLKMFDLPMLCLLRDKGEFHFQQELLFVYRVLNESASHSKNKHKMLEFSRSVSDVMLTLSLHVNLTVSSHIFIMKRSIGLFKFSIKLKDKQYMFISCRYFIKSVCNLIIGILKK
jgi:glycosyltransferase involved in cell wall biosynthesis